MVVTVYGHPYPTPPHPPPPNPTPLWISVPDNAPPETTQHETGQMNKLLEQLSSLMKRCGIWTLTQDCLKLIKHRNYLHTAACLNAESV